RMQLEQEASGLRARHQPVQPVQQAQEVRHRPQPGELRGGAPPAGRAPVRPGAGVVGMKDLNRGTRLYIVATYASALLILLDVLHGGTLTFDTEFLMLALIGAVMAPHTVHLGLRVEMSISHPFILATMILLGTANAVLISILCIASLCFIRTPRMELYRALFNISSFVLSLPFCVLIYYSYKLYLDKLEEKKQHLEDIERMNADLERKVKERTQELEVVNQKLQESNLELQRANSLKSEFLANMSH